jgi:hypothetical protein
MQKKAGLGRIRNAKKIHSSLLYDSTILFGFRNIERRHYTANSGDTLAKFFGGWQGRRRVRLWKGI